MSALLVACVGAAAFGLASPSALAAAVTTTIDFEDQALGMPVDFDIDGYHIDFIALAAAEITEAGNPGRAMQMIGDGSGAQSIGVRFEISRPDGIKFKFDSVDLWQSSNVDTTLSGLIGGGVGELKFISGNTSGWSTRTEPLSSFDFLSVEFVISQEVPFITAQARIDNIVLTRIVPEPASLALLGLGGLVLSAGRRRRVN